MSKQGGRLLLENDVYDEGGTLLRPVIHCNLLLRNGVFECMKPLFAGCSRNAKGGRPTLAAKKPSQMYRCE